MAARGRRNWIVEVTDHAQGLTSLYGTYTEKQAQAVEARCRREMEKVGAEDYSAVAYPLQRMTMGDMKLWPDFRHHED